MTEMEMFLMKEVQDIKVNMAKIEAIYLELKKDHDKQEDKIDTMGNLMMDVKESIGLVLGRTEKGDVNLSVTADKVDTIDQSTIQNIKKGG